MMVHFYMNRYFLTGRDRNLRRPLPEPERTYLDTQRQCASKIDRYLLLRLGLKTVVVRVPGRRNRDQIHLIRVRGKMDRYEMMNF